MTTREQTSLSTQAARNLATTTKSAPQMEGITARWLLKELPWVDVAAGVYRVNRRLRYGLGEGKPSFTTVGTSVRVISRELGELPWLHGFDDAEALEALADRFVQRSYAAGEAIVRAGQPAERLHLIASGRAIKTREGKYGDTLELGVLGEGDEFGERALSSAHDTWGFTVEAVTRCTVLTLDRAAFADLLRDAPTLAAHVAAVAERRGRRQDKHDQAAIEVSAGHEGEPALPQTFVDYERRPREYELSVAQTILKVHTRIADLYNGPFDQTREQLRLTVEALRERQEHELLNDPQIGLLHQAEPEQRIRTRGGPPTPDDMDELLCRRRRTGLFLAHPRAIAAFGRECNRRGICPDPVEKDGRPVATWRGVPLLPSEKIPVSASGTTSILAMRLGEDHQGVVGLHQTGIPDEIEPSLNVRFMGIDDRAILRYLVSAYYSVAVLVPDAIGILDDVEVGR